MPAARAKQQDARAHVHKFILCVVAWTSDHSPDAMCGQRRNTNCAPAESAVASWYWRDNVVVAPAKVRRARAVGG